MTNEQVYILVGIPMLFNATLIGLVIAYLNAKIGKVESSLMPSTQSLMPSTPYLMASTGASTTCAICGARSFGEWKEVLDARLKHIEERG